MCAYLKTHQSCRVRFSRTELGLVPIMVDAKRLDGGCGNITFQLHHECNEGDDDGGNVYSGDLVWVPQDDQEAIFGDDKPRPVHDDILIAKLLPGQTINLDAQCAVNVGQEHSKWSPVATASYRLLPKIVVSDDIVGDKARALTKVCPMGVFDIEDAGDKARVRASNPRECTMCRECTRLPEFSDKVKLMREANHFIFSVETVGCLPPEEIFRRSMRCCRPSAIR